MNIKVCDCPRCGENTKVQKRLFSAMALSALITWGDLEETLVDEAICDDCYKELRDVLIENTDELSKMEPLKLTKAG